jgi:hypothetical protein
MLPIGNDKEESSMYRYIRPSVVLAIATFVSAWLAAGKEWGP